MRRINRKAMLLIFAGLGMMIWNGCKSKNENENQKPGSAEQTKSATGPRYDTVTIANMKFSPDTITVKKGDTLVFINNDIVPHNVTEKDSAWQSQTLNPEDIWKFAPDKSYDYFCSLHMVMKGKITVE
ncbi:MAG: cupredoxin domain-containing protein [Chitinophagaceae bacterium]|nr:cupredoxin domain-containing protein [Bacteroidota bacterium]MCC6259086.1 cupredoxin domain-containing protein [Chitinophagaceae bacterium]MCW5915962.1 cupredoxin domain-containing protein [Ferruginibacter sp.]